MSLRNGKQITWLHLSLALCFMVHLILMDLTELVYDGITQAQCSMLFSTMTLGIGHPGQIAISEKTLQLWLP